jgi:hypothetical protein
MTRHSGRRSRYHDYDGPYKPLPRPQGCSTIPRIVREEAHGWWVGGEWIEQSPPQRSFKDEQRSRPLPIVIDDHNGSECYEVPPPAPQTGNASRGPQTQRVTPAGKHTGVHFDFNDSEQTVPWAMKRDDNLSYQVRSPSQA